MHALRDDVGAPPPRSTNTQQQHHATSEGRSRWDTGPTTKQYNKEFESERARRAASSLFVSERARGAWSPAAKQPIRFTYQLLHIATRRAGVLRRCALSSRTETWTRRADQACEPHNNADHQIMAHCCITRQENTFPGSARMVCNMPL